MNETQIAVLTAILTALLSGVNSPATAAAALTTAIESLGAPSNPASHSNKLDQAHVAHGRRGSASTVTAPRAAPSRRDRTRTRDSNATAGTMLRNQPRHMEPGRRHQTGDTIRVHRAAGSRDRRGRCTGTPKGAAMERRAGKVSESTNRRHHISEPPEHGERNPEVRQHRGAAAGRTDRPSGSESSAVRAPGSVERLEGAAANQVATSQGAAQALRIKEAEDASADAPYKVVRNTGTSLTIHERQLEAMEQIINGITELVETKLDQLEAKK